MAKCSGITLAGTACKGIPVVGSQWCYVHHPARVEERRRHGSKGGKRGGRGRPLADLGDVKKQLRSLADDVIAGQQDRGRAAVASQVLNVYLRALSVELKVREQDEILQRLDALEGAAGQAGEAGRGRAWRR